MVQGNSPTAPAMTPSMAPVMTPASFASVGPESLLPATNSAPVSVAAPVRTSPVSPFALSDAGYLYNRVRLAQSRGASYEAAQILASRPRAQVAPLEPQKWVSTLLAVAKTTDSSSAVRIAYGADDAFPAGTDVSRLSFKIRDDYTSLVWLGGTKALWTQSDPVRAATLFYRYGTAARSPATRSKGLYWAGRALDRAGQASEAQRYFRQAAAYPDQFYGMLALERLGRQLPAFD
jgi:soluble lytic murein transglycosylase